MKFYKAHPVGAELFHAGEQMDITSLTVAFRNFSKVLENRQQLFMLFSLQFLTA
jgi:hypothetical protein